MDGDDERGSLVQQRGQSSTTLTTTTNQQTADSRRELFNNISAIKRYLVQDGASSPMDGKSDRALFVTIGEQGGLMSTDECDHDPVDWSLPQDGRKSSRGGCPKSDKIDPKIVTRWRSRKNRRYLDYYGVTTSNITQPKASPRTSYSSKNDLDYVHIFTSKNYIADFLGDSS